VARSEKPTNDSRPYSELGILLTSSLPLEYAFIRRFLLVAITSLFVGGFGEKELDAVSGSLVCLTANVTSWSRFKGLASVLDTIFLQT
jgi:hypothetical protein